MIKENFSFSKWILLCFFFIALLIGVRIYYSGSIRFLFLVWNLFLAWCPYLISLCFKKTNFQTPGFRVLLLTGWLIFFPNALYIITDIIHLKDNAPIPLWYDAVLLFTCSFAGLALAFASLANVEFFLQNILRKKFMMPVIIFFLFLGSFGVYLGRFLRWNSWDIIHSPLDIAADIANRFLFPFSHSRTWMVTGMLTCLYTLCWLFIKTVPHPTPGHKKTDSHEPAVFV